MNMTPADLTSITDARIAECGIDITSTPLPICRAPLQGSEALGSIFVQQHADGTLTVEGAWHATVRPCIPTGFLTITLTEVTGWYWCLERDFSAAGFTVPDGCGSVQPSTSYHATGEEAP